MKVGDTVYVIAGIVRPVEYRGKYTCELTGKTFAKIWMSMLPIGLGQSLYKIHDFDIKDVFKTKDEANKVYFYEGLKGVIR